MIPRNAPSMREPGVSSASAGDPYAKIRRSVVAVIAGGTGGTGWVALDNGLVVTSWRAVGFYSEVVLRDDDGRQTSGRVVHVDAERDVAFVAPSDVFGAPRLSLRTNFSPRLGENVVVLIASPTAPLAAAFASVACESRGAEPAELDPDLALRTGRGGCPVIDAVGHVAGLITAGPHAGHGVRERPCRLLPVGALSRDLRLFDVTSPGVGERTLVHRCPTCAEAFTAESDRCLSCGALLPHAFEMPPSAMGAERVVRDALASLEIVSNRVRIGPRTWRILHRVQGVDGPPTEVLVCIDEAAFQISLRVAVARLPQANHEPFYRLLLAANDQATGMCKLSLAGDVVMLSFAEPVSAFASEHDVAAVFHEVVLLADQYRKALADHFGAEPIREGSG